MRRYTLTPFRIFLIFAVSAATTAAGVLSLPERKVHPVVSEWNKFARSIEEENETLRRLNESLKVRRPERPVIALEREALYREAIRQHRIQTECLERMLAAEFGEQENKR